MTISLDFGNILTRAWNITWKNRVLWPFAILAGCVRGGGGGGGGPSFDPNNLPVRPDGQFVLPPELERMFDNIDSTVFIVAAICLTLLIAVITIVVQTLGIGGLIGGIDRADAVGSVSFGEAWSIATAKFLPLLGLTLFIVAIILGMVLVIIVPGVFLSIVTLGVGLLCFIPLLCIFIIIITMLFGLIVQFAQIGVVVDNLPVFDSLRRGWEVFRANLANTIILAIIVGVIGIFVGLVLALPLLFMIVPVMAGVVGFAAENRALSIGLIFALICFCLYLPVLLVLNGILQAWTTSAFTLAYKTFTRPAAAPPASFVLGAPSL
ncbi:MAG: hypothetical protein RMK99_14805 [Anaerolineales bacterium]|nr:hypothetical protein [Anaerolineales bacterium]